ncbi:MAG: hypothetical protein GY868_01910 [Deltaproteobacteria bacterium]|nr:hypothetical protein [Deltaproteobacteria bacterium]
MNSFIQKPLKQLKMRRLGSDALGPARSEMVSMFATSPDPFATILYTLNIEPFNALITSHSNASGTRLTLTPLINKMVACAVAENPLFNQIIFDNKVYQMEEIHLGNVVLVPGSDAISYIVVANPHLKSLETIQQEMLLLLVAKGKEYARPSNAAFTWITNFCYRTGLFKLIGEKRAFTIGYERGLLSNISLSIHTYTTPARFIVLKDVITPMPIAPRFHISGPVTQPWVKNGEVTACETLSIHLTADHRLINGIHANRFGQCLERIAADPASYLL